MQCKEQDCDRKFYAKGWCYSHYMRDYKGRKVSGPLGTANHIGPTGCGKTRCPAAMRLRGHIHYVKNKPIYKANAMARPQKEKRANKNAWKKRNPHKVKWAVRARKQALKQSAPDWLTDTQWDEIGAIYATCPSTHHVDHIIPLRGDNVCGLHVPWNLQHLSAEDNMSKGNSP